jgi:hypothetical protein
VAVTLAAIYAAARPADRVILADSNDDMPHGYIRFGGTPVEALPAHQRPLSVRGFHQACRQRRIKIYADLRDAVAWLRRNSAGSPHARNRPAAGSTWSAACLAVTLSDPVSSAFANRNRLIRPVLWIDTAERRPDPMAR